MGRPGLDRRQLLTGLGGPAVAGSFGFAALGTGADAPASGAGTRVRCWNLFSGGDGYSMIATLDVGQPGAVAVQPRRRHGQPRLRHRDALTDRPVVRPARRRRLHPVVDGRLQLPAPPGRAPGHPRPPVRGRRAGRRERLAPHGAHHAADAARHHRPRRRPAGPRLAPGLRPGRRDDGLRAGPRGLDAHVRAVHAGGGLHQPPRGPRLRDLRRLLRAHRGGRPRADGDGSVTVFAVNRDRAAPRRCPSRSPSRDWVRRPSPGTASSPTPAPTRATPSRTGSASSPTRPPAPPWRAASSGPCSNRCPGT